MKISIIGAGNVGGTTALRLANLGLGQILLIDTVPNFARAKALDLADARYILNQNSSVVGSDDIKLIKDSEIVIITAGLARKPGMTREELAQYNSQIIKQVCAQIKRLSPNAIVIVVTNPLDAMTYLALKETGFNKTRVLGMGLTLDSSRLANQIAEELKVPINEIEPCIIGSHGENMLPLARYTKVKSVFLDKRLTKDKIEGLFNRTVKRGAEIVSLFGKGSAYYAPSAAITQLAQVIAQNKKSVLPVSAYLEGEYGLSDVCVGIPCKLGRNGIENIVKLDLNAEERTLLSESAKSIKKQIATLNPGNSAPM